MKKLLTKDQRMTAHYKRLLDQLDNLMVSLTKQKHLGLDSEVIKALRDLTVARNTFKREFIKEAVVGVAARNDTVFTSFLDSVQDNIA